MIKLLFTFIVISIVSMGFSQNMNQVFIEDIGHNRIINISSNNDFNSTSLKNDFISKFWLGGNISEEIKLNNNQKNFNALGLELDQKIDYFDGKILKNETFGLVVSVSDYNFASSNYKPALWNLSFWGNENYLGDTLDLSYTHLQYTHFQKFEIGIYKKESLSFIKLGLINGNRSINYHLDRSSFYTSSLGDEIHLQLKGKGYHTDSTSSYTKTNGSGFSLEMNHNFNFYDKKGNTHVVNFNLSNIGMVYWNKNTNYNYVDSSYSFSGIEYNDIENYQNFTSDELMDTLSIQMGKSMIKEQLPIKISVQKIPLFSSTKKLQSIAGFKSILIPDYKPLIYAGVFYKPNKLLSLSTRLIYGGFGGFRSGINVHMDIKEKLLVTINTNNLIGSFSNEYGRGKSVNLNLQLKF